MKDCKFCILTNQSSEVHSSELVNTTLYEDDLVVIKPALGMSVENYLVVIAKKHINGFAEFTVEELIRIEKLLDRICDAYDKQLGIYPVIFEHGSLKHGRHPLSITHAHLHIIPIKLTPININKLLEELKLTTMNSIIDLQELRQKDYWLYRSKEKTYHTSHTVLDAPRSMFIKLVATQAGFDNSYEWRDEENNRNELVRTTIDTFSKLKL